MAKGTSCRAVAACVAVALCAIAPAGAVELVPHRAIYELTLSRARPGSGIESLSGRLAFEWADACEGYTLNQRMAFELRSAMGGDILTDVFVSTWESVDGAVFRFNYRSSAGGASIEEYRGRAELEGPGRGGLVVFTRPEGASLDLPADTVFPTEHTRQIVETALAGGRRLVRPVFEGSTVDALYEAVAFVGDPISAVDESGAFELLRGARSWPVHIAYFTKGEDAGVPEYEVRLRLFDNGIADAVRLDYGDFIVAGSLSRLEALPRPEC